MTRPVTRTLYRGTLASSLGVGGPVWFWALVYLSLGEREELNDRADPDPAVVGERSRGQRLPRIGLIWHPAGDQLDRPGQVGRVDLERVERITGVDRGTRGAAQLGHERRPDGGHPADRRHLGQLGQRPAGVDDVVVAVPRDEIRERGRRRPGGGRGRHDQPAHQGDQPGQGQPRLPVLPQLGAQQQANGAHGHPPPFGLVVISVRPIGWCGQGGQPPRPGRGSTPPARGSGKCRPARRCRLTSRP